MKIPDPIKPFVHEFAKLPGIGPRQAIRLAYYLANNKNIATDISVALQIIQGLKICSACFATYNNQENLRSFINADQQELCGICGDQTRDQRTIAIIEKETDLISIESVQKYHGVYLCLGEVKKNGKLNDSQKIKLDALRIRAASVIGGKFNEIIIAFSPTTSGDISAEIIVEYLRGAAIKITRLGRGIPIGGEVEFADPETLQEAIEGRK